MEPAILFVLVLLLLFLGVPVAVALGLSSLIIIAFFSSDSISSVALQLFTASQNYTLLAIPFFILASAFMSTGGVARRIIRFAIASVGHFRGGLAMASVLACMMFAALSGSSPATVVAIGTIAIAGMRQVGYSKEFAAGIIANAGTLGILIPPSIVMVVYSAATDVSVGRMFLAGVVPGLVAGLMLMVAIYVMARVRNLPAEEWKGFHEIVEGGKEAGWGLFLIIIILGGIYGGVFTPTEAAAVAAVYSFAVALFVYRDMGPMKNERWVKEEDGPRARVGFSATVYALAFFFVWMILSFFLTADWDGVTLQGRTVTGVVLSLVAMVAYAVWRSGDGPAALPRLLSASLPIWRRNLSLMGRNFLRAFFNEETRKVTVDAARTTVMLMFIIVNALLFAHVLTAERIPQAITGLMVDAGFTWFTFLIAVNLLLLLGGQFMEPSGLLLIVAPVVFPIAMELGVDPVHLGIIMVVNMEIGMITPPIGLNLFVTSGITGMSLIQVVRAAAPFVAVLFIFLILVTYMPVMSTWLPYSLMGPEIVTR
ncbi:MAG: C4-dicarboxylate ABC transporter [Nitratireductor sp.]|uniref:TRAP transporter large permease n=1 Tax=Nitratireductor sp. B36 TaxID=2762059 RepID=UPI000C8F7B43|nr:TRAP transporter large permease subunit [Nitratireductor sp. B36]MAS12363.1 C4-dicarboxylate ABC transporter [Nitratireductor sp.]MCC5778945.1 TRAP transporter large permease subunit [Nitratireductor sp. B36]